MERVDVFGRTVAAHVPDALIRRIDIFNDPAVAGDPFDLIRRLRDEPPVIYNLCNPLKGQSWLPTRAETVRQVLSRPQIFSAVAQTEFSKLVGETWRFGPIEMDAPDHGKFRRLMNPWFSPQAVDALSDRIRARAVELIAPLAERGGCEFVRDFAIPFPISIFMELMGLPRDLQGQFLGWVGKLLHAGDRAVSAEGARAIVDFLRGLLAERRAEPRDDIASWIARAEIDGQPISDDDALGAAFLLFAGGLDTVTASLAFHYRFLAAHPDRQAALRADPALIPAALEEFLRSFSPVHASRQATRDTTIGEVAVRKGDWVTILYGLASLDGAEFARPDEFAVDRTNQRHFAFGFGIHFCMGANLARRELTIAMQEWLARIPPFRLADPNAPIAGHGGFVFGVDRLELAW